MKFSVIMHTVREDNGHLPNTILGMMVDSMLAQDFRGEYELIIVDLLWGTRREQFEQLKVKVGGRFPVMHIPDRDSPFKDRNLIRICGPKNTGAIFASGTHLVFTDDCQVIPPNALSFLAESAQAGLCATMAYEKRKWGGPGVEDISRGADQRGKSYGLHTPGRMVVPMGMIGYLGGTMSMLPITTFEAVNGWDETFDGSRQLEDGDMIFRLVNGGFKSAIYDSRARIIEYECANYGSVIAGGYLKCNAAYGYYIWPQNRVRANELAGDRLLEVIDRMAWKSCVRFKPENTCANYGDPCIKIGDNPELLRTVYTDPRLKFNIRDLRDGIRAGAIAPQSVLGVTP